MSRLILYTSDDGHIKLDLRVDGQTAWLTQLEIAELFQTTKQNVSLHARNIFAEKELDSEATVKESLTVRFEGEREVKRSIQLYNLDLILAIGYRVRSPRGTQFRQWATTHLREYLVKGFVMDDERLKNPGGWDYFDELLPASAKFGPPRNVSTRRSATSSPSAATTGPASRRHRFSSPRSRTSCSSPLRGEPPPK